jgi:hypothetical protein
MKNIILLSTFTLVFSCGTFAQVADTVRMRYASSITNEELQELLLILASDEYEGRETGKPGQKKAAQFIADYYKDLGVAPCNNGSYFQQYPLKEQKKSNSFVNACGKKWDFIKDFYFFGGFETDYLMSTQVVFMGYGIDDEKYSDYEGRDIKDRLVVLLDGEPKDSKGNYLISGSKEMSMWSQDMFIKIETAKNNGAAGVIMVNSQYDFYITRIKPWLEMPDIRLDYPTNNPEKEDLIPYCFATPEMVNAILADGGGKTLEFYAKKISKKKKPLFKSLKTKVEIHVKQEINRITAENVLCYIEGSDPRLKNEVVVVSAHYDHIGIGSDGQINNGADDDGSGTVSSLEIAEAWVQAKKEGHGPKRSVLVLNVSGEEKGLLGSEWYSEFPIFSLENTVCDLNIDMIGRIDDQHKDSGPEYVYVIGSDKLSTQLHNVSEETNQMYTKLELDYTYNDPKDPNRFYYRSDHYNFAKHNIPVIFYFSGVHEDYHKPGDDTEKILFDKMEKIAQLIFLTSWEIANREQRLVVDVQNDFEQD